MAFWSVPYVLPLLGVSRKRECLHPFLAVRLPALPLNLVVLPTLQSTRFDPWRIIEEKLTKNNLHSGSINGTQFKWIEVSKFIITIYLRKSFKCQFTFAVKSTLEQKLRTYPSIITSLSQEHL